MGLFGDVVDAQHLAGAVRGGAHKAEEGRVVLEDGLAAVGVEGGFFDAGGQQPFVPLEDLAAHAGRVGELGFQGGPVKLLAVDGAVAPGLGHAFPPVAAAKEGMGIDPRHPGQAEEDGLAGHEAVHLKTLGLCRRRVVEGVVVGDVEFVGALAAVWVVAIGDESAVGLHPLGQTFYLGLIQNSLHGPHPNPIMGGHEVEIGGGGAGGGEAGGPLLQMGGVARGKGVQGEGGQGEVVDQLGLVLAVAKVADVFGMGHVGFGDQQHLGGDRIQGGPHGLDQAVGLGQMEAGGADFLPHEGDGIQPDQGRPLLHVQQKHV